MSMIAYNEATVRKCIVVDGEPYMVLSSHVFRKQMRKPVNQTKLKNLITGKVMERSFHQAEMIEEADLGKKNIIYIYARGNEYWFHAEGNPGDRFSLSEDLVGDQKKFLKEKMPIEAMVFDEKIIGVTLPIKMDFLVTEAPPSMKGNTAQGGSKVVTLETGATVNAPLFVNEGDIIRVNTDTGDYVERVEKK